MTQPEADRVLAELEDLHDPDGDPELEALQAAVLLEDALGVVLDDEAIDELRRGGPAAAAAVHRRLRQGQA